MESEIEWGVLGAADVGAPHKRERIWVLANAKRDAGDIRRELSVQRGREDETEQIRVADTDSDCIQRMGSEPQPREHGRPTGLHDRARGLQPWPDDPADAPESELGRVVDGMANRANRIRAIGNGQVPICAAVAWSLLGGPTELYK